MRKSLSLLILSAFAVEGCAPSKKFTTQVDSKNIVKEEPKSVDVVPGTSSIHFSNTDSGVQKKPYNVKPGSLDISFETSTFTSGVDTTAVRPALDVTFVLDITSSMGKQLSASKNGFKSFLERLKADGFDARFSLFTFEDDVNLESSLTDFDSFESKLSKISLGNGADIAEASLLALQDALADGDKNKRMEAVPVIILVTDAVGHNGGGSNFTRDCSLDKTVASFGSAYGKSAKFFYSVPTNRAFDFGSCYESATNVMYDKLFASLGEQSADPSEYRGQSLGWPFKEDTLSTELPNLLKEKITPKALVCVATKYLLSEGDRTLASGDAADWKLNAKGKPSLTGILSGEKLASAVGKSLKMEITRCCDESKETSACKKEKKQVVEFKLSS